VSVEGLTVVVPTYNSSNFIEKAILSVYAASLGRPFEILLVDDFSDDIDSIEKITNRYENVHVIRKDSKSNASHSRNMGMHFAKYDLVFFLDSDDELLSSSVERRIELHNRYNLGVVFGDFFISDGVQAVRAHVTPYQGEEIRDYLFARRGGVRNSTVSVSKRRVVTDELFDSCANKHQDWAFIILCYAHGEIIGFDNEPSCIIHVNGSHRMSAKSNISASAYFVRNYLSNTSHINEFSRRHWVSSVLNNDTAAIQYFSNIYKPSTFMQRAKLFGYKLTISSFFRFVISKLFLFFLTLKRKPLG